MIRRREDGYHDLASVVHTISLADELQVERSNELVCRSAGLDIRHEDNLVTRAARLLSAASAVPAQAELTLLKRIPVAGGLGGGSSDAATALVSLNTLWGTGLSSAELAGLGARLGADVPFFIEGGAALMTGRGDRLERLPALQDQWLVLVLPTHTLEAKTALLYTSLESSDFSSGAATARAADRLRQGSPLREEDLVNAFAPAARRAFPGLEHAWAAAEHVCQRRFFLSGAGPTLFTLAVDRADARRQQANLGQAAMPAITARTVRRARHALPFRPELPSGTLKRDPRALCLVVQW